MVTTDAAAALHQANEAQMARYVFLVMKRIVPHLGWFCFVDRMSKLNWPVLPQVTWEVFSKLAPSLARQDHSTIEEMNAATARNSYYVRHIGDSPKTYWPFFGPFMICEAPSFTIDDLQRQLARRGSAYSALLPYTHFLTNQEMIESELHSLKFWSNDDAMLPYARD